MAWRIAGDRVIQQYLAVRPGASTVNGFFNSTDIGKLVEASSNHGLLYVGTTNAVGGRSILGILTGVPAAPTTPGSTDVVYVQPIAPGETLDVDYSTSSDIVASTNFAVTNANIGSWFHVAGAGTSSGTAVTAGYIDPTTAQTTLAGSTVGIFKLTGFSTKRKAVQGIIATSALV